MREWTKRRVERDGYREWRVVEGDPETGLLIAQDMWEATADRIIRDHELAALAERLMDEADWDDSQGALCPWCGRTGAYRLGIQHRDDCAAGEYDAIDKAQEATG